MFATRVEAGQKLAAVLEKKHPKADVVLGIARGGVVVADVIARKLKLPMGVVIVKKLGAPENPELAIGALGESDATYIDEEQMAKLNISKEYLFEEIKRKHREVIKRQNAYKTELAPRLESKQVILTDDGTATGATIFAAISWMRHQKVGRIFLALPVAPQDVVDKLCQNTDECVILERPETFTSLSEWYTDFAEVTDEEVKTLLATVH